MFEGLFSVRVSAWTALQVQEEIRIKITLTLEVLREPECVRVLFSVSAIFKAPEK